MQIGFNLRVACIAVLAAGLPAGCGGNTQAARPEVDQFVLGQLIEQRLPGVSLVVVRDGAVIYAKSYGKPFLNVRRDRFFGMAGAPSGAPAPVAGRVPYPQHRLTVIAFTSGDDERANARKIVRIVSQMFARAL
jgi:hypothetical protein